MNVSEVLLFWVCLMLSWSCSGRGSSRIHPSPEFLRNASPADLVELLGEPDRIEQNLTVFGSGSEGWVTDCDGYGYNVSDANGQTGIDYYYFQGEKSMGYHPGLLMKPDAE